MDLTKAVKTKLSRFKKAIIIERDAVKSKNKLPICCMNSNNLSVKNNITLSGLAQAWLVDKCQQTWYWSFTRENLTAWADDL